jgi:hypothetical protein
VKTYDLKKGTKIRLRDDRRAELSDSTRKLARLIRTKDGPESPEMIMSYEITAYLGTDGAWRDDVEYSKEELAQRRRREQRIDSCIVM